MKLYKKFFNTCAFAVLLIVSMLSLNSKTYAAIWDSCAVTVPWYDTCTAVWEVCVVPYGSEEWYCDDSCGNYQCEANEWENYANCPDDCDCGNGVCDYGEWWSCSQDCFCNDDNDCDAQQWETQARCGIDECGCNNNTICEGNRGETIYNCADCAAEWDGYCSPGESPNSPDCVQSLCGNGQIDAGESCDWTLWCGAWYACSSDCQTCDQIVTCGNGIIETELYEQCDTASNLPNMWCNAWQTCKSTNAWPAWYAFCYCDTAPVTTPDSCSISFNTCQQPCYSSDKPFDVFFVMDKSYSMVLGNKLKIMKTSFNSIIDALPTWSRASLITFNASATIRNSLTTNLASLRTWDPVPYWSPDYPQENSLTNYVDAFAKLTQEVNAHKSTFSWRNQLVYFFSDGEPTIWWPFTMMSTSPWQNCTYAGVINGQRQRSCSYGCDIPNDECQYTAATAAADRFHTLFSGLQTIAIGLDVAQQHHYILHDHVATPNLFSAIDSSVWQSPPVASCNQQYNQCIANWWLRWTCQQAKNTCLQQANNARFSVWAFCSSMTQTMNPLNKFVDLFCEMTCEPPLCKTYTWSYASQPAIDTPTWCVGGTYSDVQDTDTLRQWQCTWTDGNSQICDVPKIPTGPMCHALDVQLLTGTTYAFDCHWTGTNYQIVIADAQWNTITTLSGATWTYTFATGWVFTATCFIDGITWMQCPDWHTPGWSNTHTWTVDSAVVWNNSTNLWSHTSQTQINQNNMTLITQPVVNGNMLQTTIVNTTMKTLLPTIDATFIAPVENNRSSSLVIPPLQKEIDKNLWATLPCINPCQKTITVVVPEPEEFDLALKKTIQNPNTVYMSGDLVTFQIEVINQWDIPAHGVKVVDYIPLWLTLQDPDWLFDTSANQAIMSYASLLNPGESALLDITFLVNGSVTWTVVNRSEILADDENDIDSTPDRDNTNDCYWGDNVITWNGNALPNTPNCTSSTDEDDHDPAQITVWDQPMPEYVYDLRIKKDVSAWPYVPWQTITYTIAVLNTGNIVAWGIVTDMLPAWLLYTGVATYSPSWYITSTGTWTWQVTNLEPWKIVTITYQAIIWENVLWTLKNNVKVVPNSGLPNEEIPDQEGVCEIGHNPLSNDFAVPNTNNRDCEEIVIPESMSCVATAQPDVTSVRSKNHTMTVQCDLKNTTWVVSVDCGNGTTGTMLTNTSAECKYTEYGSYVATCMVDDAKIPWCNRPITLEKWGGGDPSSICISMIPSRQNNTYYTRKHDADIKCDVNNYSASDIVVDCGNWTKKPWTEATCEFREYGSYTIQCLAKWKPVERCSTSLTLEWNTWWWPNCGNGIKEKWEQCDDWAKNWTPTSLCSKTCSLKVVDPDPSDTVPVCAFVDPPSIQMGEYVPFWWDLDDELETIQGNNCTEKTVWKVRLDTMQCEFTVQAPWGKTYTYTRKCNEDNLKSVKWYNDLQKDLQTKIMPRWWQSVLDSSEWKESWYGEYAISLEKITYDACDVITSATNSGKVTYEMTTKTYAWRVCQFNFAVTAPYMMQKWSVLSSLEDDRDVLQSFHQLDWKSILDRRGEKINFLTKTSNHDTFEKVKKFAYEALGQVVSVVDATHPLALLAPGIKKSPREEIYLAESNVNITHTSAIWLNRGKATTIIVKWPYTVTINWWLPANLLLIVPEWTVVFNNLDCDNNDSVEWILLAKDFKTVSTRKVLTNTDLREDERCQWWQLIVKWLIISDNAEAFGYLRSQRRSTLARWFDGTKSKEEHIYGGASLRIDANTHQWDKLPPLARQTSMVFKLQWTEFGVSMPVYLDGSLLPLYLQVMIAAGEVSELP